MPHSADSTGPEKIQNQKGTCPTKSDRLRKYDLKDTLKLDLCVHERTQEADRLPRQASEVDDLLVGGRRRRLLPAHLELVRQLGVRVGAGRLVGRRGRRRRHHRRTRPRAAVRVRRGIRRRHLERKMKSKVSLQIYI